MIKKRNPRVDLCETGYTHQEFKFCLGETLKGPFRERPIPSGDDGPF